MTKILPSWSPFPAIQEQWQEQEPVHSHNLSLAFPQSHFSDKLEQIYQSSGIDGLSSISVDFSGHQFNSSIFFTIQQSQDSILPIALYSYDLKCLVQDSKEINEYSELSEVIIIYLIVMIHL